MFFQDSAYLDKMIAQSAVPPILLFAGKRGGAQEVVAKEFVRKLLGLAPQAPLNHPDLLIFVPEGKLGLHAMEAIRLLKDEVYLPPYQAERKIFLLLEAERMGISSSNALLKTFEEPLATSLIFLVTSHPERISGTIRSRCQTLFFHSKNPGGEINYLTDILISLPTIAYDSLLDQIQKMAEELEKRIEMESMDGGEGLSPIQKAAQEKEREGEQAVRLSIHLENLFEAILGWYRDLLLLRWRGNPSHLFHKAHHGILQDWLERGETYPLEKVETLLKEAGQSFERSNSLKGILERVFIELKEMKPLG